MARIRTIKPDFWTDETLTECSLNARLLFIGTWNFADDKGNLEHSAKQLKMKVFPADDVKVLPLLNDLITHGLLIEYSVSGKKYLHIKGFEKHQVINRPSSSSIPVFDDSLRTHGGLTEGREGKGEEGNGKETPTTVASLPDWLDKEKWKSYVKLRTAKARTPESLKAAIEKLDGFRAVGHDPNQIVATSLANGWQGLFEPKVNGNGGNGAGPPWWASNEGIQAKARELGIESRKGESWNDLKTRISESLTTEQVTH